MGRVTSHRRESAFMRWGVFRSKLSAPSLGSQSAAHASILFVIRPSVYGSSGSAEGWIFAGAAFIALHIITAVGCVSDRGNCLFDREFKPSWNGTNLGGSDFRTSEPPKISGERIAFVPLLSGRSQEEVR